MNSVDVLRHCGWCGTILGLEMWDDPDPDPDRPPILDTTICPACKEREIDRAYVVTVRWEPKGRYVGPLPYARRRKRRGRA